MKLFVFAGVQSVKPDMMTTLDNFLDEHNIYDLQIANVSNSTVVTDKGEILFAMLNREIDWVRTDGEKNQTNYYRNIDDMKIVDDISNINIEGRECEECDQSKYWIEWTGNGSPGVTVLKFEVEWRYNEYEYAE